MINLPKNDGLNFIPFIDVILVLLAIILCISNLENLQTIKVDLPKTKFNNNLNKEQAIVIYVDSNNIFYLNNTKIYQHKLNEFLSNLNKNSLIELRSDKLATFESFIK